jgi:hypothetical protein
MKIIEIFWLIFFDPRTRAKATAARFSPRDGKTVKVRDRLAV